MSFHDINEELTQVQELLEVANQAKIDAQNKYAHAKTQLFMAEMEKKRTEMEFDILQERMRTAREKGRYLRSEAELK